MGVFSFPCSVFSLQEVRRRSPSAGRRGVHDVVSSVAEGGRGGGRTAALLECCQFRNGSRSRSVCGMGKPAAAGSRRSTSNTTSNWSAGPRPSQERGSSGRATHRPRRRCPRATPGGFRRPIARPTPTTRRAVRRCASRSGEVKSQKEKGKRKKEKGKRQERLPAKSKVKRKKAMSSFLLAF